MERPAPISPPMMTRGNRTCMTTASAEAVHDASMGRAKKILAKNFQDLAGWTAYLPKKREITIRATGNSIIQTHLVLDGLCSMTNASAFLFGVICFIKGQTHPQCVHTNRPVSSVPAHRSDYIHRIPYSNI